MRPRLPALILLVLASSATARIHRSNHNQHAAWFTMDATRVHMIVRPESQQLVARVHLRGHFRTGGRMIALNLHPGMQVTLVDTAWGPGHVRREDEILEVHFPRPGRPGERFHAMLEVQGTFHDPTRGPGPGRQPVPSPGVGIHLDPVSGLQLPREAYWYPRPSWADPQELEVRLDVPRSWVVTARLAEVHSIPKGAGRRVRFLRSQGVVPRPVGLAAGPYLVETRRFGDLEVRYLRYKKVLAEHPDTSGPKWQAIESIMKAFQERFGPPGRGRFDLVELSGARVRRKLPTFLGQGSFAWVQSPRGTVEDVEYFMLARELARAWWERKVAMASWERAGLIHFAAMLATRWDRGEEVFLAFCRRAAAEYGSDMFPGRTLYPFSPAEWEKKTGYPDPVAYSRNAVLLLLSHLQRQGEPRVLADMRRFTEAWEGRRARLPDLLDYLDG